MLVEESREICRVDRGGALTRRGGRVVALGKWDFFFFYHICGIVGWCGVVSVVLG